MLYLTVDTVGCCFVKSVALVLANHKAFTQTGQYFHKLYATLTLSCFEPVHWFWFICLMDIKRLYSSPGWRLSLMLQGHHIWDDVMKAALKQ